MIGPLFSRFPPGCVWLSDILLSGNVQSGLSTVRARVSVSCVFCSLNRLPLAFGLSRLSDIYQDHRQSELQGDRIVLSQNEKKSIVQSFGISHSRRYPSFDHFFSLSSAGFDIIGRRLVHSGGIVGLTSDQRSHRIIERGLVTQKLEI